MVAAKYNGFVNTVDEVAAAIKGLSAKDRAALVARLPELLPEIDGDAIWESIIRDPRPRPALEKLFDDTEAEFRSHPERFRPTTDHEFERNS